MTRVAIASTVAMILLAVSVHPAQSQQCGVTLPIAYLSTVFNVQISPSGADLVGITADIRTLLQNEVIPALECGFNGQEAACPATSCSAIAQQQPQQPSGDYWVTNSSGAAVQVYCDLTGECCNGSLGRTRVGNLNLSDPIRLVQNHGESIQDQGGYVEERWIVAPALYSSLLMEHSTTVCAAGLLATSMAYWKHLTMPMTIQAK